MSPAEIQRLRRRLGLSQAEAGAEVGVSQQTWSAWENGERRPGGSALILLRRLAERAEAEHAGAS